MTGAALVHVVDDDIDLLDSLRVLLESVDLDVATYPSVEEFLEAWPAQEGRANCLLLDVRMPGMSGMSLLEKLGEQDAMPPTIVLTGHGDIPMAVQAMKLGAADFVTKPFRHDDLLDSVQRVLRESVGSPTGPKMFQEEARRLWKALTPQEQEVFEWVVQGVSNEIIARELGVSVSTVESDRVRIMEKMNVRSVVGLVLIAVALNRY
jgi:FixJ family two-component response regulator